MSGRALVFNLVLCIQAVTARPFEEISTRTAKMVEKVILKRIAHAYYSHTDIDKTKTFLKDFGLTEVAQDGNKHYFRGYGDLPYIYVAEDAKGEKGVFKGVAFEAESEEDLLRASRLPVSSSTPLKRTGSFGIKAGPAL